MGRGRKTCIWEERRAGWEGAVVNKMAQKGLPRTLSLTVEPRARAECALQILKEKDRIHFNASPLSIRK